MIGLVDLDGIDGRQGTLGYWFDRAAWGRGLAFEAVVCGQPFGNDVVQRSLR